MIQQVFSTFNNGQQRPTIESLYKMLYSILEYFGHVYLVVDALDEYPSSRRSELLNSLHKLRKLDPGCLHLLATSRREKDIEDSFSHLTQSPEIFWDISVQGVHVRRDIDIYILHRMRTEDKFQK